MLRKAVPADIPQIEALIARSARGFERGRLPTLASRRRTARRIRRRYPVAGRPDLFCGRRRRSARRVRRLELQVDPVRRRCTSRPRFFDARSTHAGGEDSRVFVDPADARRGIGTLLLERCEKEAWAHGFSRVELMATLPGVKLYAARGYIGAPMVRFDVGLGETIEFIPMHKVLVAP